MGYARYDTPMGPAGYGVADRCHAAGCRAEVDRGMAYLCGTEPGHAGEYGCGAWFCDEHMFSILLLDAEQEPYYQQVCTDCRNIYDALHPTKPCDECGQDGYECECTPEGSFVFSADDAEPPPIPGPSPSAAGLEGSPT